MACSRMKKRGEPWSDNLSFNWNITSLLTSHREPHRGTINPSSTCLRHQRASVGVFYHQIKMLSVSGKLWLMNVIHADHHFHQKQMHIYDYWYIMITYILIQLGCILGDKDIWVAKVRTVTELARFPARISKVKWLCVKSLKSKSNMAAWHVKGKSCKILIFYMLFTWW